MKRFSIVVFFVASLFTGLTSIGHAGGHLPDLVETAVKGEKFKTLVTALGAAGLVETLKGKGPFTVFAPTDEAFAKIDAEIIADLLKPENKDKLTAILTYHVVSGKVMSSDIKEDMEAPTVNGKPLSIKLMGRKVMINEATVIVPDVNADNGVIHIIDTVLLP